MDNILSMRISKLARLAFFAVLTTTLFVLPVAAQETSSLSAEKTSEYRDYIGKGNQHLEQGRYRQAIAEFNRALLLNPDSKESKRGIIKANQAIAARSAVPDIASIEVDRLDYHLTKGTEHYDAEKYDEAVAEWQKVLQIDIENKLARSLIDAANRAKVDLLIEKGHDEFFAAHYGEAIALWEEAQKIVPESPVLRDLIYDATVAHQAVITKKMDDASYLQTLEMQAFLRKKGILPEGVYPDGIRHKDISEKPAPREAKGFGAKEAILKELAQPVAFEFDCEPLRDVLAFLTTITGINILVDEDIFTEFGYFEDCYGTPVDREEIFITIHVNDLPLESALNGMFRQHGLGFSIERDFIYISTPDVLRGSSFEQLETRFYHIKDTSRLSLPKLEASGTSGGVSLGGKKLNLASGSGVVRRAKRVQSKKLMEVDADFTSYSIGKLVNILKTFVPVVLDSTKTTKAKKTGTIREDKKYGGWKENQKIQKLFDLSRMRWADPSGREILSLMDFDAHTNTLIVRNTPSNLDILEVFLEQLDREPRMLAVEAQFLTYSILEAQKVGIDWESSLISRGAGFLDAGASIDLALDSNVNDEITGDLIGRGGEALFRFTKDDGEFLQLTFDLLAELKSTQTISAPRIVTLNNKPAIIQNVTTTSFRSDLTIETTTTTAGDNIVTNQSYDQTFTDVTQGVTLSVTPQIEPDNTIRLFILPDVSKITQVDEFETKTVTEGQETINIITRPTVARQSLFTNVVVSDGDTLVLGGFIENTSGYQKTGIPFLKDIPFVGRAFENETKISDQLNLLVFVTVHIMDSQGVAYSRLK